MNDHLAGKINPHRPGRYEIRLQGQLPQSRADDFPDMTISHEPDATSVLRGYVPDQSALHGILNRIRDLNITLISVQYIESEGNDKS